MKVESVVRGGRRVKIERRMKANCQFCGARMVCPDGAVPWAWAKSAEVEAFVREHKAHGFDRMVGFEMVYFDPDTDEPTDLVALTLGRDDVQGAA